jgi:hypothetical protein
MTDEAINRLPSWLKNILALASALFFVWLLGYDYISSRARNAGARYTIGQVTGTSYVVGPSSHSVVFFTYTVGNITYRQSSTGDVAAGCSRCLVKFAEADPTNFEFFNRVCVPDSITRAPAKGWEKPPFTAAGNAL